MSELSLPTLNTGTTDKPENNNKANATNESIDTTPIFQKGTEYNIKEYNSDEIENMFVLKGALAKAMEVWVKIYRKAWI